MTAIRQKKSAITATPNAIEHLKTLFENAPDNTVAIKLGLKNAGCAGMSYTMDFVSDLNDASEIIEFDDNIKIIIEAKSLLFLFGMQMDYETTKLRSGFIFNNPNQTDACGCGESVKLVPVDMDIANQNSVN